MIDKVNSINSSEEVQVSKGCTPYQARKLAEKSITTKTITRIL